MIHCKVETYGPCLLVTFDDGKTLLLQSQSDQESFAESCGNVAEPTDITECLEDYYDIAEFDV